MALNSTKKKKIIAQGKTGEKQFETWLNEHGFGFVSVKQNSSDLAHVFRGAVKRPDHLLLIPQIGFIAVDVKNKKLSGGGFTLSIEGEIAKALEFERLFGIYLWYAFKDSNSDGSEWHFISAYDALEYGQKRVNESDASSFLFIPQDRFQWVTNMDDFQKLFSGRVGRLGTLTRMVEKFFNTKS